MPSRAPTYYHWSLDKPCTTNQVYGFEIKDTMVKVNTNRKLGPLDYTRPFSNSAFFPQISKCGNNQMTTRTSQSAAPARSLKQSTEGTSTIGKTINKGYVMGYTPVTDKVIRSSLPNGVRFSRSISAPAGKVHKTGPANEIFLWHTLAGSLVHVKNNTPKQGAC